MPSNVHTLPSCSSYQDAKRIWDRAPVPRNKDRWPEHRRPLDGSRKSHYAIVKDGDTYYFQLYSTSVVVWKNEDTVTLDSSYDSVTTRQFAWKYLPHGIQFGHQREEGATVKTIDGEFRRGIHTFTRHGYEWRCTSPTIKPQRTVLDPVLRKEIRAKLKPFTQWIKGLWAVCGNDGSHPWIGKEAFVRDLPRYDLDRISAGDMDEMEKLVLHHLNTYDERKVEPYGTGTGTRITWTRKYGITGIAYLLHRVNNRIYRQENAYIKINYDAPLPRLEKKGRNTE